MIGQGNEGARITTIPAVEVTIGLEAPPAEVYRYLTDPARYVRWMGSSAVLEPRPGGRYQVAMSDGFRAAGTFTAAQAPRLVAFTWGFADDEAASRTKEPGAERRAASDMPAGSTQVTVTLAAAGDGTRLTLRHEDLPSADLAAAHQVAWQTYLPRLAAVGAGLDPGPEPHAAS